MSTIAEVERLALDLSESDRALLVAHLLRSLPPFLYDEDEGVAEALRRAADFESDPDIGISLEQLAGDIPHARELTAV
jgi:putative addiction module component (TIGR02574 family)